MYYMYQAQCLVHRGGGAPPPLTRLLWVSAPPVSEPQIVQEWQENTSEIYVQNSFRLIKMYFYFKRQIFTNTESLFLKSIREYIDR